MNERGCASGLNNCSKKFADASDRIQAVHGVRQRGDSKGKLFTRFTRSSRNCFPTATLPLLTGHLKVSSSPQVMARVDSTRFDIAMPDGLVGWISRAPTRPVPTREPRRRYQRHLRHSLSALRSSTRPGKHQLRRPVKSVDTSAGVPWTRQGRIISGQPRI